MPWGELEELVRPCYYEGKRGNKPYDLELMLRIYLLQNLYNLSDEDTRNEVIDSWAFSDFCGVESSNQIPDGDTIGRFRNLLINNHIHEQFSKFDQKQGEAAGSGCPLGEKRVRLVFWIQGTCWGR